VFNLILNSARNIAETPTFRLEYGERAHPEWPAGAALGSNHRFTFMAHQGLSRLPARDLVAPNVVPNTVPNFAPDVVPNSSGVPASGPVAVDGPLEELLTYWLRNLPTRSGDFQSFVSQVAELARVLTRASGSAIAFYGEEGTICRARSGKGAPPLGAAVNTTSGISKQCLDSGIPLRCDDIANDDRVDPEISRAIGIRAVAVVPIYSDGEIYGILEVFSSTPGSFTDQHLRRLQQLAEGVGSAANTRNRKPICGSNEDIQVNGHPEIILLFELEPAYRSFFRNFADLMLLRSAARGAPPSTQIAGWNDVFVDSPIPWQRFFQSVFLHIVAVGMVAGLSRIGPRELVLSSRPFREAQVTYYRLSESFPARESSRPEVQPSRRHMPAHREADGQKMPTLASPPPAMPTSAIRRLQQPGLGAETPILPPPTIGKAEGRQSHLPNLAVVAPPPDISSGSGLRRMNGLRVAVVPPSPEVRGLTTRAGIINAGQLLRDSAGGADLSIVPPPPAINDHAVLTLEARGAVSNMGVQVVGPPPSIQAPSSQARGERDARGRAVSVAGGVSSVVPPPQSLEGTGNSVGGSRGKLLANGGSEVVPPPPSLDGGGKRGAGAGARSLARAGAEGGLPPASAQGAGHSGGHSERGDATVAKEVSTPSELEVAGNRMHPVFQDVQLRVIGLVWAPPRSSYFSNFEVFIAQKGLQKEELQFIKLVYVFLPYQQRLSEYGFDNLKVRTLRVTRDPTCDESLMQMAWPEGENVPTGPHPAGDLPESTTADHNNALPCYRTTADDYRRAVSQSR
jgi:GAF domain